MRPLDPLDLFLDKTNKNSKENHYGRSSLDQHLDRYKQTLEWN
jgi:hypothetical protein